MKTITEIVQRLLDDKHINVEEAIILLKAEINQQYHYRSVTNPSHNLQFGTYSNSSTASINGLDLTTDIKSIN